MRTKNSIKNIFVSTIAQVINMVLSFVTRTIFIKLLATEYLGLSGLFTNVLAVLSLSELGIGDAIIINLYKPIAEGDEEKICKYMNFYKRAYFCIGSFILIFGIISLPFLSYIVKTDVPIPNLDIIYLMFVVNAASSYFFAYKRTILTANQKEYINTVNKNIFLFLQYAVQILVLLVTHNYILYLSVMLFSTLAANIRISVVADKQFPYLKKTNQILDKYDIKELFRNLKAIIYHKVGNIVINSTDNLIISVCLGVYWVGLYSNYLLITSTITTFALIIFSGCSASIGAFNATENKERVFSIFKVMKFVGFWVYGFCSICFITLFQPFIELWIGKEYLVQEFTVMLIVVAFFMKGMISISGTFIDISKLFVKTRFVPWIMAFINIVVSIVLAQYIGLAGVILGTIVSYSFTKLWIDPFVLCKYKFEIAFGEYLKFAIKWICVIIVIGYITYVVARLTDMFVIKMVISLILPNVLLFVVSCKTSEFKYLFSAIKALKNK